MGAHTYDPDDGEPRIDPGPDAPTDVRVAQPAAGDPEPEPEETDAAEEKAPPKVEDVRPRRPEKEPPGVSAKVRETWQRLLGAIATGVVILSVVIAVFHALHIVFVVFDANKDNGIVEFINGWATDLAYGFRDLFVPKDPNIAVTVNYGLAAIAYLVAGRILAGILRRLG